MKTKMAFVVLMFFFSAVAVPAQDTLSGNYKSLHLTKGRVFVADVVTVADSLVVEGGVTMQLLPGATIVVNGALLMNGHAGNRILVTTAGKRGGNGFAINGANNARILISYTNFQQLTLPLNFLSGWVREKIDIGHCEFTDNEGRGSLMQVMNPYFPPGDDSSLVEFSIHHSLFTGNKASVYFEDLSGQHLALRLIYNTFSDNRIPGYGKYSFSANLLFGRFDAQGADTSKPMFYGNTLQNNYLTDNDADTILQRADFGVYGGGDSLLFANNYWGTSQEAEVAKGIYDYTINYTSPKLMVNPFLTIPSPYSPAHFYKISGDSLTAIPYGYILNKGLRSIHLTANKKVNMEGAHIQYRYIADSANTIRDTLIRFTIDTSDLSAPVIKIMSDNFFKIHTGYIRLTQVKSGEDETVPDVYIGYQDFLKKYAENKNRLAKLLLPAVNDSLMPLPKPVVPVITKFKRRYEVGLLTAFALYYGTLANKNLFKNDYNSMLGIQFRYSFQSHVSLNLILSKGTLTGSDLRSGDSVKIARGLSFKTPITMLSAQIEFDFVDNSVYSSKSKLHPVIGFGADYIKFNPMGEYLGKYYDLQKIGTGGQTIPGSGLSPYPLTTFGAPVTAQIRYFLNKHTVFSVFATYHLTFTDYLDDVGPTPYPDPQKLAAANPGNEAAAVYLSNPTNRVVTPGMLRSGSTAGSDSFFCFGISLSHHF